MRVSVFGIGYVGAVTSACLSESGHNVIAVDISEKKVNCIKAGRSPIIESNLEDIIAENIKAGRLTATTDLAESVAKTEMSLICVGTPSKNNGSLDLSYVETVCQQIGEALKNKDNYHIVVLRSTVLPGTLLNVAKPALEEASGKKAGIDFGLGNNPEFLREGTAVQDYCDPTQIVIGALDARTAKAIEQLYEGLPGPRTITDVSTAEGVKYVSNAWRAAKISFANEVGNILKRHGVDSHKVMKIIFEDTRINMGPSFLMPGFAFGGSCLPKDNRAIRASANDKGLETPIFDSLLTANELQVHYAMEMVRQTKRKKVGLLGLSFKPYTDDLRESPLVALAELLLFEKLDLKIYDPCVNAGRLIDGGNREYIENTIPHIANCMVENPQQLIDHADIVIIGNGTKEFRGLLDRVHENACIVDLVRLHEPMEKRPAYAGICW